MGRLHSPWHKTMLEAIVALSIVPRRPPQRGSKRCEERKRVETFTPRSGGRRRARYGTGRRRLRGEQGQAGAPAPASRDGRGRGAPGRQSVDRSGGQPG